MTMMYDDQAMGMSPIYIHTTSVTPPSPHKKKNVPITQRYSKGALFRYIQTNYILQLLLKYAYNM